MHPVPSASRASVSTYDASLLSQDHWEVLYVPRTSRTRLLNFQVGRSCLFTGFPFVSQISVLLH